MARKRYNGLGTGASGAQAPLSLGAALTASATAVTFNAALTHSGGTAVPTLAAGDYIPLSIKDASGNVTEVVNLTAYTAGATTGTIARAQEGYAGVAHASGDKVVHGPTTNDLIVPRARVYASAAQTLANNANTTLAWDSESYDTDGLHDNVTNNSRLTLTKPGAWLITAQVAYSQQATATGRRIIWLNKNTTEFARNQIPPISANATYMAVSGVIGDAVAGDYVELIAFQDSGVGLTTMQAYGYLTATYLGD